MKIDARRSRPSRAAATTRRILLPLPVLPEKDPPARSWEPSGSSSSSADGAVTATRRARFTHHASRAEEGRITGVGACNRVFGALRRRARSAPCGSGPLASTMMACPDMETGTRIHRGARSDDPLRHGRSDAAAAARTANCGPCSRRSRRRNDSPPSELRPGIRRKTVRSSRKESPLPQTPLQQG